jgi:hypothetical protein
MRDVIALPEQANLAGALWLDLLPGTPAGKHEHSMFCILIGAKWSQPIFWPAVYFLPELVPACLLKLRLILCCPRQPFTEAEGTFLEFRQAAYGRSIRPSKPAGEALAQLAHPQPDRSG